MQHFTRQLFLTAAAVAAALAQGQRPADTPRESGPVAKEFEVASIKPVDPNMRQIRIGIAPGGRFTANGITTAFLIQQAYDVKPFQITGAPAWVTGDRFEVNAN